MKWLLLFLLLIMYYFGFGQTNPYCGAFTPSAPISLTGVSNQTITGLSIIGTQGVACIRLTNCDHIRIYNNILNGNAAIGQDPNRFGVVTTNCHDIQVVQNNILNCSNGVYFTAYSGATANMRADSNWIQDMKGPYPKGCAVQFNQITGAGSSISYNNIENLAGISAPQDNISCFQSNGTAASNIIITRNNIYGAGVVNASNSGIIMGDGGGSYQSATYNIIVNAAHCGLGIVSGSNYTAIGNTMLTNSPTIINPVCIQINTCNNVNVQNNQAQNTVGSPTYFTCITFTDIANNWHATINPNILQPLPGCATPAPNISYSPNTFVYYINAPITPVVPVNVGGAATSWSISPLQSPGLNFSTTSGSLTGTPIALKPKTVYVVAATNSTGQSSTNLTVTVIDHAPIISYAPSTQIGILGTPITTMTPIVSTLGGTPVSYSVTPALPPNLTLNTTTGVISGTGIALSPATSYTIQAFNTGGTGTASVTLSIVPPAPAIPNISFSPNTYTLPVNVAIVPISPINIGGVAASWAISPSTPTGISFSTSTGILTGLPTVTSASTPYDVSATNISGTAHTTLHLAIVAVTPPAPLPSYSPSTLTLTINQSAILLSPSNSGGVSTNWSILPALPSGLVINSTTGIITGVGTTLSPPTNYVISATNGGGTGTANLTIQVVQQSSGNPLRVGGFVAKFE